MAPRLLLDGDSHPQASKEYDSGIQQLYTGPLQGRFPQVTF